MKIYICPYCSGRLVKMVRVKTQQGGDVMRCKKCKERFSATATFLRQTQRKLPKDEQDS